MVTLTQLTTQVRRSLARGNSLDDIIPTRIRQAARWIERNYTFQHMKKWGELVVSASSSFPRVIDFPNDRVKSFEYIRLVIPEGFTYLSYVEDRQIPGVPTEEPSAYWLSGMQYIYFDATPGDDLTVQIAWNEYTSWGGETNWLLENADDAIEYRALLLMASELRDQKLQQIYSPLLSEALKTLIDADQEIRWQGSKMVMGYK